MSSYNIQINSCRADCAEYASRQGCGPVYSAMQESQIKSLIVLVNGVRLSIQQHIDAGKQLTDIVAGTLVQEGMCQECAPCDNGYYLKFCNKFDMGACFMCRDNCSRAGFFLSHANSEVAK
jgi:hypothetical protein